MMDEKPVGLDLQTPINASLTAFYQRSFAYFSVKGRLPATLAQTINIISKKKEDLLRTRGEGADDEIKVILNELATLRLELLNSKPLRKLIGDAPDIALYNKCLESYSSKISSPNYFNVSWLFCECYMFRRVVEAIEQTKQLKDFDPYQLQKEDAYYRTVKVMVLMGSHLLTVMNSTEDTKEEVFTGIMELNLWGNKCDLSHKLSRILCDTEKLMNMDILRENILRNDLPRIWEALTENTVSNIVDIVLDNAGYELFTDFCLAEFIVANGYAQRIRFHVKVIPWFVSDVMAKDFHWTLHQLQVSKNETLKLLGEKWCNYVTVNIWTVEEHNFWTLPLTYKDMAKWDIQLYRKLSEAKLIIFKGDVNYRKLLGERNWFPTASFVNSLQGFHPSKLFAVRTLKAQIICGLDAGVAESTEENDKDWLVTGKYGIIQFSDKIVRK